MTQRRDFIKRASLIAAGTLAATRLDAQGGATDAATPSPSPAAPSDWDMSWTERVTGKHRMVFDMPEVAEGMSLHHARSFFHGYAETLGLTDADLSAGLVVRLAAVPVVLDDVMWADGHFAGDTLKDPVGGEPAKKNPFIRTPADARHRLTWPDGALDDLMGRGMIVLVCELAFNNTVGQVARRKEITRQEARELVTRNLLPGVIRMPSGVFATCHAQSLGCGVLASA